MLMSYMEQKKYHLNKWASSNPKMYPVLEKRAKVMRSEMTEAEKMVWELVRANRLGTKFRRQQPVGIYVADFLSVQHKLVIEVDGSIHEDNPDKIEHDRIRDEWMLKNGYRVIRVTNEEVMEDPDEVRRKIVVMCKK